MPKKCIIIVKPVEGLGVTWGDISFSAKFAREIQQLDIEPVVIIDIYRGTNSRIDKVEETLKSLFQSIPYYLEGIFFDKSIEKEVEPKVDFKNILNRYINSNDEVSVIFFPAGFFLGYSWQLGKIFNNIDSGDEIIMQNSIKQLQNIFHGGYPSLSNISIGFIEEFGGKVSNWIISAKELRFIYTPEQIEKIIESRKINLENLERSGYHFFDSGFAIRSLGINYSPDTLKLQQKGQQNNSEVANFMAYMPWFARSLSEIEKQFICLCATYAKTKQFIGTISIQMSPLTADYDVLRSNYNEVSENIRDQLAKKIVCIKENGEDDKFFPEKGDPDVIITYYSQLSHKNFQEKMLKSSQFIALTGNQSFQEGLFMGKVIFFVSGMAGGAIMRDLSKFIDTIVVNNGQSTASEDLKQLSKFYSLQNKYQQLDNFNLLQDMLSDPEVLSQLESGARYLAKYLIDSEPSFNIAKNVAKKMYPSLKDQPKPWFLDKPSVMTWLMPHTFKKDSECFSSPTSAVKNRRVL